jgi:DNA mismatch repair protein MutS
MKIRTKAAGGRATAKKNNNGETPLMKQYNSLKAKYPDALLLFRVGDFYETFGEDAIKTANILGIVLTRRANGAAAYMELAGFPYHALDTYLPKLVRAGHRVAICDQLEDPKTTKTIVKRGVTELVTPGVSCNDKLLDHRSNNFLAAVHLDKNEPGVAFVDISTGEFLVASGKPDYIRKLLQSLKPSEVVFSKHHKKDLHDAVGNGFYTFGLDEWIFTEDYGRQTLNRHFNTLSLKGFGIEEMNNAVIAAGAAMHYLSETQHDRLQHITSISRMEEDKYVWLDRFSIKNLEVVSTVNDNAKTLLDILDETITPMGARLLRRWLMLPLKEIPAIEERLNVVEFFLYNTEEPDRITVLLKQVGDLERIISKVSMGKISPRELVQMLRALDAVEPVKAICESSENKHLQKIADQLNICSLIRERIRKEIKPDAPAHILKGGYIASGVSAELDELRQIAYSGKDYLLKMQQRESAGTGIPSLKVGFNNVFGYYLEVTHTHKDKVPTAWVRKQTLVNAERYITDELKQYEEKILGAEEKILAEEQRLYTELILCLQDYISPVQLNASLLARLDCLLSYSKVAEKNYYVKPHLDESHVLDIKDGRHPVIEKGMPPGEAYIANDIYLDNESQQIIIVTGPNMAGKSALLRQTALIVLMAQAGSFVPAKAAHIGVVDKIFTRVGASDNISSGESTFMVEMNETASILNNISDRSLVLLDEIGRGTSTYDGISIAWSIVEYLHEHPAAKARTLFATHYHELNELSRSFPRVKNYNVSVKEAGNRVIFLRKLVPGGSEHSFGIHVARMAGMPSKIVNRAGEVLKQLEASREGGANKNIAAAVGKDNFQLSFFNLDDPLLEQIREEIINTDINTLTPVEALMKLNEIKKLIGK